MNSLPEHFCISLLYSCQENLKAFSLCLHENKKEKKKKKMAKLSHDVNRWEYKIPNLATPQNNILRQANMFLFCLGW